MWMALQAQLKEKRIGFVIIFRKFPTILTAPISLVDSTAACSDWFAGEPIRADGRAVDQ